MESQILWLISSFSWFLKIQHHTLKYWIIPAPAWPRFWSGTALTASLSPSRSSARPLLTFYPRRCSWYARWSMVCLHGTSSFFGGGCGTDQVTGFLLRGSWGRWSWRVADRFCCGRRATDWARGISCRRGFRLGSRGSSWSYDASIGDLRLGRLG